MATTETASASTSSQVDYYALTLQPLQTITLNVTGIVISCTEASGPFNCNIGHGVFPLRSGLKITCTTAFKSVVLNNPTLAVVSVSLYVGAVDVSFVDNQLRNCPTYTRGGAGAFAGGVLVPAVISAGATTAGGLINLPASGTIQLPGSDNGNPRAQLVITNPNANLSLNLVDSGAVDAEGTPMLFATILPGSMFTIASNGYFTLVNPNAGGASVIIGETFYQSL